VRRKERKVQTQGVPQIIRDGSQAVIRPGCDVTATCTPELRAALKNLVAEGVRQMVFDLAEIHIIDSSGIGLLVAVHNSLARLGGVLAVINASPDLLDLFKALRLDRHFSITSVPAPGQA
jgi:anti-anti-sigma factor